MKKFVILTLVLLLLPMIILAADEVTFSADVNYTTGGVTLVVKSGSVCDQIVANPANLEITLSANSHVSITSADKRTFNLSSAIASTACGTEQSSINLPAQTTATTITVTPSSDQCGGSGGATTVSTGGGGGAPTPAPAPTPTTTAMPSTTTGEVTATAAGGGKTTLTTAEDTTAAVEMPANTVTANTAITISSQAKADVIASRPTPSGKEVVGGYIYNYAAKAGQTAVTDFSKTLTLTFTYTNAQVEGLEESTLKVYYWKESVSQWVSLVTTVDAVNNKLTAESDHFTYFVILGRKTGETVVETTTEETSSVSLADGDLIRNPNAAGTAQHDIYIVKLVGSKKFRRLVLSPHVFNSYGHLKWENVKTVTQATMDMYTVSEIVRCQDAAYGIDDPKVYKLAPDGDTGVKQHLNMTAAQFETKGYDWDSIYIINKTDRDAYTTGAAITADSSSSSGSTIKILVANLRVRSLPSLSGTLLTTVKAGETYDILDESDGWYKITANGATGWCYGGDTGGYAKKQ